MPVEEHIEALAKELKCSICLGLLSVPVARLPCCHYFCQSCVTESVKHRPQCPICKSKITRRDIARDETMDRVVDAFQHLDQNLPHIKSQPLAASGLGGVAGPSPDEAICWLKGVDDADFQSPSKSISVSAFEKLKKQAGGATVTGKGDDALESDAESIEKSVDKKKKVTQSVANSKKRKSTDVTDVDVSHAVAKVGDILAGLEEDMEPSQSPALPVVVAAAHKNGSNKKQKQQEPSAKETKPLSKKPAAGVGKRPASAKPPPAAKTTATKKKQRPASAPSKPVAVDDDADDNTKRRIPTRLLKWSCGLCTFENKGGEKKCEMCGTVKAADNGATTIQQQQQFSSADADTKKKKKKSVAADDNDGSKKQQQRVKPSAPTGTKPKPVKQQPVARKLLITSPGPETTPVSTTTSDKDSADEQAPANKQQQWTVAGTRKKLVLLGSGLSSQDKANLKALASASGASLVDKWSSKVTHVVCGGADNANTAKRTFKYFMGILHGKKIVSHSWVDACMKKQSFVDEARFYITKDALGFTGGPEKAMALTAAVGRPPALLDGCEIQLQGEFGNKDQMMTLIKAAGGKLIHRLPSGERRTIIGTGSNGHMPSRVVLCEAPEESEAALKGFKSSIAGEDWYARALGADVVVVSTKWLTDSISLFEVLPTTAYVL